MAVVFFGVMDVSIAKESELPPDRCAEAIIKVKVKFDHETRWREIGHGQLSIAGDERQREYSLFIGRHEFNYAILQRSGGRSIVSTPCPIIRRLMPQHSGWASRMRFHPHGGGSRAPGVYATVG
jgi:hypothetical protein